MQDPHGVDDVAHLDTGAPTALNLYALPEAHRVINGAKDVGEGDLRRESRQIVTAVGPLLGADDLRAGKLLEDFREEVKRHAQEARYFVGRDRTPLVLSNEEDQDHEGVVTLSGQPHREDTLGLRLEETGAPIDDCITRPGLRIAETPGGVNAIF